MKTWLDASGAFTYKTVSGATADVLPQSAGGRVALNSLFSAPGAAGTVMSPNIDSAVFGPPHPRRPPITTDTMDSFDARTFYRRQARLCGGPTLMLAVIIGFCGVFGGLLAPLVWTGTSIAAGLSVGVPVTALALWVLRFGWRLTRMELIARPGGVSIRDPLHDHELGWDQIQRFERGSAGPWSSAGRECPVVLARLIDGRAITVHALRVDHGVKGLARAEQEADELCGEIERLRPAAQPPRASAAGTPAAAGAARSSALS